MPGVSRIKIWTGIKELFDELRKFTEVKLKANLKRLYG